MVVALEGEFGKKPEAQQIICLFLLGKLPLPSQNKIGQNAYYTTIS